MSKMVDDSWRSAPEIRESIRVGVAGWSYADWRGVLYPRSARKGGEDLELVSRLFDCVEINSSFYREPEARVTARWAEIVADRPRFRFTAKATRSLTHERQVEPPAVREIGARVLDGLRPLLEADLLGALLAQFPPWFRDEPRARERIAGIVRVLRPVHVCVEIRHPSFLGEGFFRFLQKIGAGFVNVDLPRGPGSLPPSTVNTSAVGYVRLHGRNHETWFDPRAGRDDKYNYLYTHDELVEWSERVLTVADRTLETYVITNNHYKAQAPANAIELRALLGQSPPEPPESLVERYPSLARVSRREPPAPGGASKQRPGH